MKRLSNAELRVLYSRRSFLQGFLQTLAIQCQTNLDDSWERSLERIEAVREEIKQIVDDPKFDLLVDPPSIVRPTKYSYSPVGTMANVIACVKELLSYINETLAVYQTLKSKELEKEPQKTAKVFVGHGRNEIVRSKVKDFLRDRCQLQPLILQELPSASMTIIEKLEKYGRTADYAVLILTADDLMNGDEPPRARQNVIQELGWFQGVLGRKRTAILCQKGVEIASNIAGVAYIEFIDNDVERGFESLRKEFEEAGLI